MKETVLETNKTTEEEVKDHPKDLKDDKHKDAKDTKDVKGKKDEKNKDKKEEDEEPKELTKEEEHQITIKKYKIEAIELSDKAMKEV